MDPNDPMANEADVAEEYCRQLINQALELTQNESLRLSLQQLLDREYGGAIELPRLTTEDVCFVRIFFSNSSSRSIVKL